MKSKKWLLVLLLTFGVFGVLAMYDFWRWEYDYGHNLDPTAAIIVPGMAYQPPLIGFKQLLNFGAYSIPDIGGWAMSAAGILIFSIYIYELKVFSSVLRLKINIAVATAVTFALVSCDNSDPAPIMLNKDVCSTCKMVISNGHFGCEFISNKGKVYKFDDISCMQKFVYDNKDKKIKKAYVNYYILNNNLISAENAYYIKSELFKSPMGGNIAAFKDLEEALTFTNQKEANIIVWNMLFNN